MQRVRVGKVKGWLEAYSACPQLHILAEPYCECAASDIPLWL